MHVSGGFFRFKLKASCNQNRIVHPRNRIVHPRSRKQSKFKAFGSSAIDIPTIKSEKANVTVYREQPLDDALTYTQTSLHAGFSQSFIPQRGRSHWIEQ